MNPAAPSREGVLDAELVAELDAELDAAWRPVDDTRAHDALAPRRPRRRGRSLLSLLGLGLSAGLLAFVLLVGVLAIGVPAVTGSQPMTILTGSMAPSYPAGTLVIVRPTPADEVRIGDAITFQLRSGEPEVVTHRVIGIGSTDGELSFITQGDANAVADPAPVREVQLRGVVWYSIPFLGWVNMVVNGEHRAWIVGALVIGCFGYAGYAFTHGTVQAVRRGRRP